MSILGFARPRRDPLAARRRRRPALAGVEALEQRLTLNAPATITLPPVTVSTGTFLPSQPPNPPTTVALSLPAFDPALGTLTAATVTVEVALTNTYKFESLSVDPRTVSTTVDATASVGGPGVATTTTGLHQTYTADVAAYDGTNDFGGDSGRTFAPVTTTQTAATTVTGAALSSYSLPGANPVVTFTAQASGSSSGAGPGNLIQILQTTARATVTVSYQYQPTLQPLRGGDTATIGFWHNKNGQALINALNGGKTATQLATWLATNFPDLYGADSANDLTGKTNADVAALIQASFGVKGAKTDAQILAGALAAYATDSDLAGTVAAGYGFNVSSSGTGARTYNVGSYGTAIGLANDTSYTVFTLLHQADLQKKDGTFDANAFNAIFDGINQGGDIN